MTEYKCVYEHWRPDLNQCFYVGKGNTRRPFAFSKRARTAAHHKVQEELRKAGLSIEVRVIRTTQSDAEAASLEVERIAFWRASGAPLVNMTEGGLVVSESCRVAHKAACTGRKRAPFRPETIKKMSAKAVLREAERKASGYTVSDDARRKIGLATKRRIDAGELVRSDNAGRPKQRVRCVSDGRTFDSIVDAARHYGVSSPSIMRRITGEPMLRKRGLQLQFEAF